MSNPPTQPPVAPETRETSETPAVRLAPLDVHVVAHTHWDREWYHPAERFRQGLVLLVGELLRTPLEDAQPFLLDGQAVVLDDVLAVHPEWAPLLGERLRAGVLEAGPWYVLADELIPSGEAMVRNLLAGHRTLARFGATPPAVCYSPDAFGHMAALPALAQGFGLPVAVVWRGYGGPDWPAGDTVRWQGLGAEVLLWHLPPDGYEYGSALPSSGPAAHEQAEARWRRIEADAGARAVTGTLLLPNGADHHALQRGLPEAIRLLHAAAAGRASIHRSSLGEWARTLRAAAAGRALPTIAGELRNSRAYTWALQGTFATRSGQKRAVARADRLLRWDVEPWQAMAHLLGREPDGPPRPGRHRALDAAPPAPSTLALLHSAWRTFLRTLPHDTLCGCSVDGVAKALDARVRSVRSQAAGLRAQALDTLLGREAEHARTTPRSEWAPQLVLRNRLPRPRWGVAEATLLTTLADVPVGPDSAGADQPTSARAPQLRDVPAGLLVQPRSASLRHVRRESPRHYPDNDAVHAVRALVWVPEANAVPATGLACWPMPAAAAPQTPEGASTWAAGTARAARHDLPSPPEPATVTEEGGVLTLGNGALRVTVRDGRVAVFDSVRAIEIPDAVHVVWQRDVGDSYTSAPRGAPLRLAFRGARIGLRGPLRAGIDVHARLRVAKQPTEQELAYSDAAPVPDRGTTIRVALRLSLDAGAGQLRIDVRVRDRAPDHRLRLIIATGVACEHVTADAAFGPVARSVSDAPAATPHDERAAPVAGVSRAPVVHEHVAGTAPLHRWVAAANANACAAVVSDGLAEYEAWRNGCIAITLVRATGELSRSRLPERPGHAGWPARIPGAQGPGTLRARLGLVPLSAYDPERIEQAADALLCPLIGDTWRDAPKQAGSAAAPRLLQGIELRGAGVKASAIAVADDGDGVILRAVNLTDREQSAEWVVPGPSHSVTAVRLDETALDQSGGARPGVNHDAGKLGSLRCVEEGNTTRVQLVLAPRTLSSVRVSRQ